MSALDLAKKYDRSITVVLTALAVISVIYLSAGSKIDAIVEQTHTVQELKRKNAIQNEINTTVKSDISEIKLDVKEILRTMPRR